MFKLIIFILSLSFSASIGAFSYKDISLNSLKQKVGLIPYRKVIDEKQLKCLTDNIYFEARSEKETGKIAIALVTLNRLRLPRYPNSICEVVHQKTKYTCQFAWVCDNSLRVKNQPVYDKCRNIAKKVLLNRSYMKDITYGATNFHRNDILPKWAKQNKKTTVIGKHVFYKL